MLRGLILRRLGLSGDEETINKCKEMFQAHLDETEPIPADLRTAVYWYVVLIMIYVIRNFEWKIFWIIESCSITDCVWKKQHFRSIVVLKPQ